MHGVVGSALSCVMWPWSECTSFCHCFLASRARADDPCSLGGRWGWISGMEATVTSTPPLQPVSASLIDRPWVVSMSMA